ERLQPELIALLLPLRHPELDEPDDLRIVRLVRLLAPAAELEVHRDAGEELLAGLLGDEMPTPRGIACVEDGHHVDPEPASYETHRDGELVRFHLLGREVGERL